MQSKNRCMSTEIGCDSIDDLRLSKGFEKMTELIQYLGNFNWQMIIGMFAIFWYFTHDLKSTMERQNARTDRLYEMFIDLLKEGRK